MISYSIFSDKGNREINEDSCFACSDKNNYCFVVADGLGGHEKGEIASKLVVESFKEEFKNHFDDDFLTNTFVKAQGNLLAEQKKTLSENSMKTTAVAMTISGNRVQWAHIGDSRNYHFNRLRVIEHTLDHSVPQMLVFSGQIKEKDIRNHPDRNRVLRVMGVEWDYQCFEVSTAIELKKGHSFLLCTDGFWELIDEKHMMRYLFCSKDSKEWLEMMISEVQRNGVNRNMDNYTAIAIRNI